MTTKPTILY